MGKGFLPLSFNGDLAPGFLPDFGVNLNFGFPTGGLVRPGVGGGVGFEVLSGFS